jgi:deoxyribonuclease-4
MPQAVFRFGTVGSPISTPKKPGGSVGGVLRSDELGLRALELGWVQSVRVSEDTCLAINSAAQKKDVLISVHAPYFINLNADAEEWPKSRKRLMDAALYGNLAGASDIIFHPGSYFGKTPDEVLPNTIERLLGCVEELRAAGNPVILRPETMGKSAMLGSFEDTLAMSSQICQVIEDSVKPCLDFAHLHARSGDGAFNTYAEWAHLLEIYANTLGEAALQSLHIHLSGIEYGPKGEKNHLKLADADLDLNALFQALADSGCSGRILCESPAMEDDALVMKDLWQQVTGAPV